MLGPWAHAFSVCLMYGLYVMFYVNCIIFVFVMYLYTNDDFFLNVSRKFKSYDTPLNRLKMLFYKFVVVKKMGRL